MPLPAPRPRRFAQLDVFAARPQRGNPLAVVLEAEDLGVADMQRVASWTNLSETTFLLPPSVPGADYRVRIFTRSGELPFAGHPTLGTARAWLHAGGAPAGERIVQECGAGLIEVRRDGDRLAFAAPPLARSGPLEEAEVVLIAEGLGVPRSAVLAHSWADNGPGWRVVELAGAEEVLALTPDLSRIPEAKVGVMGRHRPGRGPLYEVRAFAPGGVEDPVTGSLQAGIAQWLLARGPMPAQWTATQGTALDREGRVQVSVDETGTIWVGGDTVLTIEGTILV
ncbi:PhzF family phenazine biosynthesis protein [Brachybacterium sp. UNK5269]|uniref:PhzF family phenazine biosynthesis protein n=1 Tax=Brachybacterium sp. UNK5269 TaxID=3408576 RepID=UPI003BB148EB